MRTVSADAGWFQDDAVVVRDQPPPDPDFVEDLRRKAAELVATLRGRETEPKQPAR